MLRPSPFAQPPADNPLALLIHPDAELSARLGADLEEAGFQVLRAAEPDDIGRRAELRFAAPDVIVLPLDPDPGTGDAFLRRLRANALTRGLPVVALDRAADGAEVIRAVEQALAQRSGCGLD